MSEEESDFKGCRTVPVLGEKNLFEGQRFVQWHRAGAALVPTKKIC